MSFRQEVRLIKWKTTIMATFASLMYTCTPIAAFISLITVASTGIELTSYNTFMILSLISTLRMTVSANISIYVNILADFAAALNRIQGLLEFDNDNIDKYLQDTFMKNGGSNPGHEDKLANRDDSSVGTDIHRQKDPAVLLQNVVCSWSENSNTPTLNSLCLSVDQGDLVFITGRVGCGKSSLLSAILREIPLIAGITSYQGKIAWVGQQPWIFSGTVRDNVLFGEPFDPNRYQKALEACGLINDLQRFPDSDLTVVGERGTVLSGGQQARVELARAVYSNADIYLLDDPLSAVDSKVGYDIFEKCIKGALNNKTRLMVTHNLEALQDAKHIVVMEEGCILAKGDFSTLCASGFDLDAIVQGADQKSGTVQMEKQLSQGVLEIEIKSQKEYSRLEIAEEDRMIGSVSWNLYWRYIQAGMHCILAAALATFFLIVQG